jgi:hypothetical protein
MRKHYQFQCQSNLLKTARSSLLRLISNVGLVSGAPYLGLAAGQLADDKPMALRERRTAIIAAIAPASWNARRPHQRWIAARGLAPKSVSRIDRAEVTSARDALEGPAEVAALSREGDILPRVPFRRVRVSDPALAGGIVCSADGHPCPEDEARGSRQETTESRVIQSGVRVGTGGRICIAATGPPFRLDFCQRRASLLHALGKAMAVYV